MALLIATLLAFAPPVPARYDIVIVGGRLVDGTGRASFRADLAIKDGRVAAIGTIAATQGARSIDARNLIVAPGFIDVHTHADDLADHPAASNFVHMGVTTVVAGNCGSSAPDVAEALARIRDAAPAVNYATLIGHNTIRRMVMGTVDRLPSPGEMARMKSYVWKAMADGAVGFSTGLQYVPGTYAHQPEIIELAHVAANAGGIYASHMRNEGTELEEAIAETIRVGEAAGARVQISHLKVDSPRRWGASTEALALIDAARAKGLDIQADQYAYTAASSTLSIRFPAWVLEGGTTPMLARLTDPSTWAKIKRETITLLNDRGFDDLSFAVVAMYPPDRALNGLSMKDVATRLKGSSALDAQLEAARDMMMAAPPSMVYHLMSDEDVTRIMRHPEVAVASDSGLLGPGEDVPHPRGYGNNARVLSKYVRTDHALSLAEAVRKMTSLPAEHFRFQNRGTLKVGYAADVVVFDPLQIDDTATFDRPHSYPTGIAYVLVNGIPVVDGGEQTSARPGQILAKSLAERK
jgi:N-acyl-D-amino-acid deacylase